MSQRLYAIRDIRAKSFGLPFSALNDDTARRTTASTLISVPPTHLMYQFASDYELCYLGEVTDDGILVGSERGPEGLGYLSDLLYAFKVQEKKEMIHNGICNTLDPAHESDSQ